MWIRKRHVEFFDAAVNWPLHCSRALRVVGGRIPSGR